MAAGAATTVAAAIAVAVRAAVLVVVAIIALVVVIVHIDQVADIVAAATAGHRRSSRIRANAARNGRHVAAVGNVRQRIVVGVVAGDCAGGGNGVVVVLVGVRVRVHQAADAEVDFVCVIDLWGIWTLC